MDGVSLLPQHGMHAGPFSFFFSTQGFALADAVLLEPHLQSIFDLVILKM
jgi:hypothetical protein